MFLRLELVAELTVEWLKMQLAIYSRVIELPGGL